MERRRPRRHVRFHIDGRGLLNTVPARAPALQVNPQSKTPRFPAAFAKLYAAIALLPRLRRRTRQQAFALRALARQLAGAAHGFGAFTRTLFRRLLVVVTALHFAESAFPLHLLFERLQRLVDVVIADENLYQDPFSTVMQTRTGSPARLRRRALSEGGVIAKGRALSMAAGLDWTRASGVTLLPMPDTPSDRFRARILRLFPPTPPAWAGPTPPSRRPPRRPV